MNKTDLILLSLKPKSMTLREWQIFSNHGEGKVAQHSESEWNIELERDGYFSIQRLRNENVQTWIIGDGKKKISFGPVKYGDFNRWSTGEKGKRIHLTTVHENIFSNWTARGGDGCCDIVAMGLREWTVYDSIRGERMLTKLSLGMIPLICIATYPDGFR